MIQETTKRLMAMGLARTAKAKPCTVIDFAVARERFAKRTAAASPSSGRYHGRQDADKLAPRGGTNGQP
jgi:hypothetical protein